MELKNINEAYFSIKSNIKKKNDEIDDLKCRISKIENSHFYKFAKRYYFIRDKIIKFLNFIKYKIIK